MAKDVGVNVKFKVIEDISKTIKEMSSNLKKTADKLSGSFDKAENKAKGFNNQLGNTRKSTDRLSSSFKSSIRNIVGFIGAFAGFRAIQAAISSFAEFEKATIEVATILPKAQANVKELQKTISDLSLEFGKSKVEQARAFYQTISAGFVDAAEAAKVLKTANLLAIGGLTDTRTAVSGLTAILKAYNLTADESGRISDILFTTVKDARTTVGELASEINKVTPFAAQLGISFEEVAAALGAATLNGTDTATAATQLRQIFASLIKPTKQATDTATQLGFQFSAAAIKAKGLSGFLTSLQKSLGGNEEAAAKLFGNIRALSGVLSITANGAQDFNRILEDNLNSLGATADAANKVKESLDFKLSKLSAEFTDLVNNLTETFLPTIRTSISLLSGLANAIKGVIGEANKLDKIGTLELALGKELKILNELKKLRDEENQDLTKKGFLLQSHNGLIKVVENTLGAELKQQEFIVGSIQRRLLKIREVNAEEQRNTELLKKKPPVIIPTIDPTSIEAIKSEFKVRFSVFLKGEFKDAFSGIGSLIRRSIGKLDLGKQLNLVSNIAKSMLQGSKAFVKSVVKSAGVIATAIVGPLGGMIADAINGMIDFFGRAPEEFRKLIIETFKGIPELLANIFINIINFEEIMAKALEAFIEQLPEFTERVTQAFIRKFTDPLFTTRLATGITIAFIKSMPKIVKGMIDGFKEGIVNAFEAIVGDFSNATQAFSDAVDFFKDVISSIKDVGGGLGGIAKGGIIGGILGGPLGGFIGGVAGGLGFQQGGEIPNKPRFKNDGFGPAFLNAGENIVDTETNDRLKGFLEREEAGTGQPLTINISVSEQNLAKVLTNINRQGFRTVA